MKNVRACFVGLLLVLCFFSGCSSDHYTEDIRQEYESAAFEETKACFQEYGIEEETATYSLLTPDGVTMVVTGRFFQDGMTVQYVYDADSDILWTSHTRNGYSYQKAVAYLESCIKRLMEKPEMFSPSVTSVSWFIPYKEYLYDVQTTDGKKTVSSSKAPKSRGAWLHRPFFQWDMTDAAIESFLDEILHGASDNVSAFHLEILCDDFASASVTSELSEHRLMSAFSGISSLCLYEASDCGRYYLQERNADGKIVVTFYEQTVTTDGDVKWKSSVVD